jgi:dephospho-CoA kinase
MLKTGITGNIGSGKTTACRIFEHLGIPVYYSDDEAKKHYECQDVKDKLFAVFGREIFTETNDVDKKQLARIVFSRLDLLEQLNAIIHPLVLQHFEQWLKRYENHAYILFESAILYSCGLAHLFDKIIFVKAPHALIIERIMKRDNTFFDEAKQKLSAQLLSNKANVSPNYVIINDEKHLMTSQIIEIHQDLVRKK